jgi:hypothetical protein
MAGRKGRTSGEEGLPWQFASRFGKSDKMNCHRNVTGKIQDSLHGVPMNTPTLAIHYLDPAVEDSLYRPGETPEPNPAPPDTIADDLATEWDEGEMRPSWLDNL